MEHFDIIIVGGGQAARQAAESARRQAPKLSILIIGEEPHLPYDRPALSKAALQQGWVATESERRDLDGYSAINVSLRLGDSVNRIDLVQKTLCTASDTAFSYGTLILATGSHVRRLPVSGNAADKVRYLRTRDDCEQLRAALTPGSRLAVVGAGFIGLEVAATAVKLGVQVTVIDVSPRVLSRVMPQIAGDAIEMRHRLQGVQFMLGRAVGAASLATDGSILVNTTRDEVTESIVCDSIIAGIGVIPRTELAEAAGIAVANGILVDPYGNTSVDGVLAAGEVACHPVKNRESFHRLESWQVAEYQAAAVGATAAGSPTRFDAIPWFWSDQYQHNIQMLGLPDDWRSPGGQTVLRGDLNDAFSLLRLNESDQLTALIALDRGRDVSIARRLMERRVPLNASRLADASVDLATHLQPASVQG